MRDKYEILGEFSYDVVFGIGNDGMEMYLCVDGNGEHYVGDRMKGSFGKVDNSFIFLTMGIDTLDWVDKIYEWFDSLEEFYSIRDDSVYPFENDVFCKFIDEVYNDILGWTVGDDCINTRFQMLELLDCETIDELGKMLLDDHGFDIWDLDYERLMLHDNCIVVNERYLIDVDILEWTEELDDTVIRVLEISYV